MDKKCHRCQEWLSECRCAESYWKRAEMEARARAKAPELLECLKGVVEAFGFIDPPPRMYEGFRKRERARQSARALIAEIEGGSDA